MASHRMFGMTPVPPCSADRLPLHSSMRKRLLVVVSVFCLLLLTQDVPLAAQSASVHQGQHANPVIAGDHPDPSIIRVGQEYWMTSTSGDWSPQFPLFRSTDLQHWTRAGAVFLHQPEWAGGSFWAPELVYDGGRVLVYYVGRKHGGPLCVAAATADAPEGPYTDRGTLVCEQDGSIDPAFARDENGKPFLIWKEDGNSQGKATPLWAQPLTEDLVHLTGEKSALFQNDAASWEGGVVEAPFVLRHAGKFYMFYAGNACCGNECSYAEGVARADHLLGPWIKDPDNPIIRPNGTWKCPGHGSAVSTAKGDEYFLYHAYPRSGTIYLGRESVLDAITWSKDGWPEINAGHGPAEKILPRAARNVVDDFQQPVTATGWRWPVNHEPVLSEAKGSLALEVNAKAEDSFLAQPTLSADYTAQVDVQTEGPGLGSLGVVGSAHRAFALGTSLDEIVVWKLSGAKPQQHEVLWHTERPASADLHLRVTAANEGKQLLFSYSTDGINWTKAGEIIDTSGLPQWDQGLAVGLLVSGSPHASASFRHFELHAK